jgi:hypothetical protein
VTAGIGLPPLKGDAFVLKAELEQGRILVQFSGTGDMSVVEPLDRWLRTLHREALHVGTQEVVVDVRELYFMNSSCLKAFVTWIDTAERRDGAPYTIRFRASPDLKWQRRTLSALQRLGTSIVCIDY